MSSVDQNVGTGVNQDVVVVPTNQQSDPKTIELIQKIKMIVNSMKLDEKQLVHWRKRKFESALKIGENLVTIRMMFGKDKVGFRLQNIREIHEVVHQQKGHSTGCV
jgi:hypothetical protein